MVQIEFADGDLNYVDHCRFDGRLDYYRFNNLFCKVIDALMLDKDDFFILRQVKEDLSNDDDCNYDFVHIIFRSFNFTDEKVSDIVRAFIYCFKVIL